MKTTSENFQNVQEPEVCSTSKHHCILVSKEIVAGICVCCVCLLTCLHSWLKAGAEQHSICSEVRPTRRVSVPLYACCTSVLLELSAYDIQNRTEYSMKLSIMWQKGGGELERRGAGRRIYQMQGTDVYLHFTSFLCLSALCS